MIEQLKTRDWKDIGATDLLIVGAVILGGVVVGRYSSITLLLLIWCGFGAVVLLRWPILGLVAVILTALLVPVEINTGTDVPLNVTVLIIPFILGTWLVRQLLRRKSRTAKSRTFYPLLLFQVTALLSIFIGNVLWDPLVPKPNNFILVQFAQWAIFALSGIVFFLAANLITNPRYFKYLVLFFLVIGGCLSVLGGVFGPFIVAEDLTTEAIVRAPFWILLAAISGGQLLFNNRIGRAGRIALMIVFLSIFVSTFVELRGSVSNWVGVLIVAAVLIWLRWPRLRIAATILTALLLLTGILTQTLWEFGGGDTEWTTSGGSRITLATRVIEVSMANPVTGLGPAAYRSYAAMEPMQYGRAFWVNPSVNSHNNYIDIFSQTGLIGLGLFLWFMVSIFLLAWRLAQKYKTGLISGYINSMIASWAAIMVVMLLLDWFLPFVYNVGFPGFQASVLVWLFFGGLVGIENYTLQGESTVDSTEDGLQRSI